LAAIVVVAVSILGGAIGDRLLGYSLLDRWFPRQKQTDREVVREVLKEENAVVAVVDWMT